MTNSEIIKIELYNLIAELKAKQNMHGPEAEKQIAAMIKELEQIAYYLMEHTPEEAAEMVRQDYFAAVQAEALLSPGIATVIEDDKEHIYLPYYQGNIGDETGTLVSRNTRFDLASITKLFTLLEALKLTETGAFDINKLASEYRRSPFKDIHVTIADLLRFKYELVTAKRLDTGPTIPYEEFFRLITSPTRTRNTNVYSDIPFIIAKLIMEDEGLDFLSEYRDELGLLSIGYDPTGTITGGRTLTGVDDEKAERMERIGIAHPGHAGLFGTAEDLSKVFEALTKGFLSPRSIQEMLTPSTDAKYVQRFDSMGRELPPHPVVRAMGVYIEHPEGMKVSEVIPGLSKQAFAITGFTGGYAACDLAHGFHSIILPNPMTIQATAAKNLIREVPQNNRYILDQYGRPIQSGSYLVSQLVGTKKSVSVVSPQGQIVEQRNYTNMLDSLKLQQLYTLLKLRLIKRVALRLAKSDQMVEHIEEEFSGGKKF